MSIDSQFSRDIQRVPLLSKEEEVEKFTRLDELRKNLVSQVNHTAGLYNKIPGMLFMLQDGYEAAKNFVEPHRHNVKTKDLTAHIMTLLNEYKAIYEQRVIHNTPELFEELDDCTFGLGLGATVIDGIASDILGYTGSDPLVDLHVNQSELEIVWVKISGIMREMRKLKAQITNANLRLVLSIAHQYHRPGAHIQLADLVQEGSIGLMTAVDRFDVGQGNKFSTVATWWVRQGILRHLENYSRAIRLPVNVQDHLNKALKEYESFLIQYRRQPTDKEMADRLGITPERYHELKHSFGSMCSLDAPAAESEDGAELTLQDIITDSTPTPEQAMLEDHKTQLIKKALHHLDELERAILEIRYGLGEHDESTMAEVADILGVSRATIFNYEAKALEKLKNILQNGDNLL